MGAARAAWGWRRRTAWLTISTAWSISWRAGLELALGAVPHGGELCLAFGHQLQALQLVEQRCQGFQGATGAVALGLQTVHRLLVGLSGGVEGVFQMRFVALELLVALGQLGLFRYQLGCNAFGEYPSKFNGGNFTFESPDGETVPKSGFHEFEMEQMNLGGESGIDKD